MADDKRESEKGGKRRRPPTIDLKATEVASEPVKPEPAEMATETATNDPPKPEAAAPPPPEPPRGAKAGARSRRPDWFELRAMREKATDLTRNLAGHFPGRLSWPLFGAGAAGGALVALLFLALFATGALTPRDELPVTLAARLVLLESQLREIAARPQPAGLDQRALTELGARVGAAENAMGRLAEIETRLGKAEQGVTRAEQGAAKAEQTATAPRAVPADQALAARVAALEAAVRPLAELSPKLDAAGAAARDAKSRADAAFDAAQKNSATPIAEIEALARRVATLEQAMKSSEARIASTAGADKAGRLAFVAITLRNMVERGEPFAQELAAARPLAPDAKKLAPLEPFAAAGVPRTAALARELSGLTGTMLAAAGASARDGGFIDRLQANAERLVRIRPINEAPGDDPATIIGRADVKATHGDLSGALAELASLPSAVRAPAENWIGRVRAREAALAAARDLADSAVGALSKSGL